MVKIVSISLILLAIIAITYGRSTEYKVAIQKQDKTYERKDESGYEASLHLNIGVNSNSEDDNTSEGNTGEGNTSEGNTGKDNTDEGNTSEDNTGEDNTGEGNTGEDNTGEGNTDGVENLQDVIKSLKEEFESELESAIDESKSELESAIETTKSELESAINASKSELESAIETSNDVIAKNTASIKTSNDRITRLENKTQMLTPEPTTPVTTTAEPTTPESTTPESTTQTTKLSDEERIEHCGLISSLADDRITANSLYGNQHHLYGPQNSRLNTESGAGGWFPHYPYEGQWIELNLGKDEVVTAVATQGRWNFDAWITTYSVSYKSSTSSIFSDVKKQSGTKQIFIGNTDHNTVVINDFAPPLTAQFIRIHPRSWNRSPVLRFDVLIC